MTFIPYIIAILVLFVVLKILSLPMKIIIKFIINAIVGGIVIIIINLFGVGLELTWLTAAIVGFLGVPGVIIVAIMQFLL